MGLEVNFEEQIGQIGSLAKNDVGWTTNPVVIRIFDAALKGSEADDEITGLNFLVGFDALFRNRNMIVDEVSWNCAVLLSNRKNREPGGCLTVVNLIK